MHGELLPIRHLREIGEGLGRLGSIFLAMPLTQLRERELVSTALQRFIWDIQRARGYITSP
jgi:hypothetical protein